MVLSKAKEKTDSSGALNLELTATQKRRFRRKRLQGAKNPNFKVLKTNCVKQDNILSTKSESNNTIVPTTGCTKEVSGSKQNINSTEVNSNNLESSKMSSKEKSKEEILAAREAKKLAKQKGKNKDGVLNKGDPGKEKVPATTKENTQKDSTPQKDKPPVQTKSDSPKSKDEVDKAVVKEPVLESRLAESGAKNQKTKEQIMAERAAKKAAKQNKKKGLEDVAPNPDMTVKDVVETLKDIKNVAKDIQDITAKVSALTFEAKNKKQTNEPSLDKAKAEEAAKTETEEARKSKAELKAERRAKQEAQRAAKQAATEQKAVKPKTEAVKPKTEAVVKSDGEAVKEKSPKPKSTDKAKAKCISANRVNWFQHLYAEQDKEALKKIAINSNLHPAIIKMGVQSASQVVNGSNARCIALLDALKKMVKDYTLPAKTEFARGLEAHLAASLDFLWAMRQPSASQTNAVKYFRHHLTQLPNNVDEFDAKKILQEEIDRYIDDQIDTAGEAISMAVQKKISTGDNILTYGCSSLIERILREAWEAKLKFRTVVVGNRVHSGGRNMLRRLAAAGLPCTYVDITAVSFVMKTVNKVLLGAGSLLGNGSVLGAAGSAQVALAARARNVPVLVACETHKFSERVQTDAFVYNELGNPDALIDKSDENSPLKDWRSNPNLTPLNLTYDVTPASLVTAVVTEKAILPCTSAPVVLRTKLTEYGM